MNILNITTMIDLRGGDLQMLTVYDLLKEHSEINQYILCPSKSILYKNHRDSNFIPYKYKSKVFSLLLPIIKNVREKKIDIIHLHDSSSLTAALICSFFINSKVKLIFSRKRDNKIKNNFISRLKYGNIKISKIICVSKAVSRIFDSIVNPKKVITIYDAVDVKRFENKKSKNIIHETFKLDNNIKIIGNIAALSNQKDIPTFIDTAEKILQKTKRKDLRFVVIGKGGKKKYLNELIESKNLQNFIFLMGFRNDVEYLLPELDVFLLTSISEGLPLTIYEAFSSKIPVVATNAGGISEVITDGVTGYISKIKDSEKLSSDVIKILNNDKIKNEIVKNSYLLVKDRFDLNVMKKNYEKFYIDFYNSNFETKI